MSTIVRQPTDAILSIGSLIDRAIDEFLTARSKIQPLGRWESDIEAYNLVNLVVRNIESIIELAKTDMVLAPSANVLARAVFEQGVKAAWMVQPEDPFQRELRWLVHLKEEARLHSRVIPKINKFGGDPRLHVEQASILTSFYEEVVAALPIGYAPLPGNPSVEDMLENIDQNQVYLIYVLLSSFVHGGHASTKLYRKNLGSLKERGEFVGADDWYLSIWTCWKCLQVLGSYVLDRLGLESKDAIHPQLVAEVDAAFLLIARLDEHAPQSGGEAA